MQHSSMAVLWVWGYLLATIFSSLAIAILLVVSKWSPQYRMRIAFIGLVSLVLLPLGMLVPMPQSSSAFPSGSSLQKDRSAPPITKPNYGVVSDLPQRDDQTALEQGSLWFTTLMSAPLEFGQDRIAADGTPQSPPTTNATDESANSFSFALATLWLMVSLGAWGLIRLCVGVWQLQRLMRKVIRCDSRRLDSITEPLHQQFGMNQSIKYFECDEFSTPAIVGWLWPVIVLPNDWRHWTDTELRCAVAHELAHLQRRDPLANLIAQIAMALNCLHPLAYLLVARMRMDQELAADCLAASKIGGRETYVESLARLALRRTDRRISGPALAFLPDRRSLLRRLEMLNSMKFDVGSTEGRLAKITMGCLVVVAIVLTTIRPTIAQSKTQGSSRDASVLTNAAVVQSSDLARYVPDQVGGSPVKLVLEVNVPAVLNDSTARALWEAIPKHLRGFESIPIESIQQVVVVQVGSKIPLQFELVRIKSDSNLKFNTANAKILDPKTILLADDPNRPELSVITGQVVGDRMYKLLERHKGSPVRAAFRIAPWADNIPQFQLLDFDISPLWLDISTASAALDIGSSMKLVAKLDTLASKEVMQAVTSGRDYLHEATKDSAFKKNQEALAETFSKVLENVKVNSKENLVEVATEIDAAIVARATKAMNGTIDAAKARAIATNNMKQILIALHNYHSTYGHFPPSVIEENGVKRSWRVEILPFIERADLYNKYRKDEAWDSPNNKLISDQVISQFADSRQPKKSNRTGIRAIGGNAGALGSNGGKGVKLADITDGTAKTIAIVEVDQTVPWAMPEEYQPTANDLIGHGAGREQIFLAGLADGAVLAISNTIDPKLLETLLTRAGGE